MLPAGLPLNLALLRDCGRTRSPRGGACSLHGLVGILLLLTLVQLLGATASPARSPVSVELPSHATVTDLPAYPTAAWTPFCEESPGECLVDVSEPDVITLTREVWERVKAVNTGVNGTVSPMPDHEHWAVEDRWDYPTDGAGDCEDFQLLKRRLLVTAGLPRRALRMTVVLDEVGAGHAVLMLRTDHGDFILDNKVDEVRLWHETGYQFLKREGSESMSWVALGSPATTSVTSQQ